MCAHVDIGANCEDVLSAYAYARVYCTRDGRREEAEMYSVVSGLG